MKRTLMLLFALLLCLVCTAALAEVAVPSDDEAIAYALEVAALPRVDFDVNQVEAWDVYPDAESEMSVVIAWDAEGAEAFDVAFAWNGELLAVQVPSVWYVDPDEYDEQLVADNLDDAMVNEIFQQMYQWMCEVSPTAAEHVNAFVAPNLRKVDDRVFCYVAMAEAEEQMYEDDLVAMLVVEITEGSDLNVVYFNINHGSLYSRG